MKNFVFCMLFGFYSVSAWTTLFSQEIFGINFAERRSENNYSFQGLSFRADEKLFQCDEEKNNKRDCRLVRNHAGQRTIGLSFEKVELSSLDAISLLRLKRRTMWQKKPKLNHYVEGTKKSALGEHGLSQAQYFRMDNIHLPVLLQAIDVVINPRTVVTVTAECTLSDWPMFEKDVEKILASFRIVAKP
jgi:hypothetical protein